MSTQMIKDELTKTIYDIDRTKFYTLVKSLNTKALYSYFSMLDVETQQAILNLEPFINKLIAKYKTDELVITGDNRRYIVFALCIQVSKYISRRTIPPIVEKERIGYKESIIKYNAYIVEDLLLLYAKANRKWKWAEIQQEFFRRIDKQKYLRGNDKLKRDATKIMTTMYFQKMCLKYAFANAKKLNTELGKKDIMALVEQNVKQIVDTNERVNEALNADDFFTFQKKL